jgi:hypothetical protein
MVCDGVAERCCEFLSTDASKATTTCLDVYTESKWRVSVVT